MVRSIISMLVAILIIVGGGIFENLYINKTFDELGEKFTVIEQKIKDETCTEEEILDAQNFWLENKKELHAFIPHTDIKEVDLWIAECVFYISDKDYKEAHGKVTVVLELFEQIPQTFSMMLGNLF